MNHLKAFIATIGFVLAMFLAVQNVDVLNKSMTFGLHWPRAVAFSWISPMYALLVLVFLIGFGVVSFFSVREHLGRRRELLDARTRILALEQKLAPPVAGAETVAERTFASVASECHEDNEHPHRKTEQLMDSPTPPPVADQMPHSQIKDEEIIVQPSKPGWGAVILLAAALALVFCGGVYVMLNERMSEFTGRFDHVSELTGHLHSVQEEMQRSWEQEKTLVREEIEILGAFQAELTARMDSLEEQIQALSRLPEEVRKRLVAGFLRDTAGRASFLGTQMESDAQKDALQGIHDRLQSLAKELESNPSRDSEEEEPM